MGQKCNIFCAADLFQHLLGSFLCIHLFCLLQYPKKWIAYRAVSAPLLAMTFLYHANDFFFLRANVPLPSSFLST